MRIGGGVEGNQMESADRHDEVVSINVTKASSLRIKNVVKLRSK